MTTGIERALNTQDLEARVKAMYEQVALEPDRGFHFETGRALAERLGYPSDDLDAIPAEAIESFAGVGYFLDLAGIRPGETVLDLGSGSGTDSFLAAAAVGDLGHVVGVDMTKAQLAKATRLASACGLAHVEFRDGYIENPPVADATVDCVISNGVINLSPESTKCSMRLRRRCGPEAGSLSRTSSPLSRFRAESPAMPRCGRRASAARLSERTTSR
jgi:arsenite methyltransferase